MILKIAYILLISIAALFSMKKTNKNIFFAIASIFLLCMLIACFIFPKTISAQQELEIEYPQVSGSSPQTTQTSLPEYIKYIFTFIVVISGIIGVFYLVLAGIKYINSAGNPGKIKEAKGQMLSAFWGIIIILGSFIILQLINPNITKLEVQSPTEIPNQELPETPITSVPTADLLTRIKTFAEAAKEVPKAIKETAEEIKKITDECDCKNTKPICVCEKSNGKLICKAKTCYTGNDSHPCPDADNLKILQKKIIDQRDVILYYKNRAEMEKNDLKTDIEKFIDEELAWYDKEISAYEKMLSQSESQKGLYQRTIDFLKERKGWLEEEKEYKNQLKEKMESLVKALDKGDEPPRQLANLTPQCFNNVKDKCEASCKQDKDNGCHDKLNGCQPDKCSGGNPCPTSEIEEQVKKIKSLPSEIEKICDEIISIVDNIQKEKTPEVNL